MSSLTIPATVPSASEDAERLRKAFVGWGTDEKTIISILAHRTASQRLQIRSVYAEIYGEELSKSLDKEISGDFERIVLLWTLHPAERDALLANEAVKKWTHNSLILIEIACTRSSGQLLAARQAYHARYKRSLEEDVAAHTAGDFRKLLFPLVTAIRYEGEEVNMTLAKSEAKLLHEKIDQKAYNDDELIRIITTRSKAQLIATFNQYNNQFGHPINKDLKADPEDKFLAALRATIRCIVSPEKYFEKTIRLAINKMGTDEHALTRVIATRAEADLSTVKETYLKRNSVPLDRAISNDTSGDYKSMLLALLASFHAISALPESVELLQNAGVLYLISKATLCEDIFSNISEPQLVFILHSSFHVWFQNGSPVHVISRVSIFILLPHPAYRSLSFFHIRRARKTL